MKGIELIKRMPLELQKEFAREFVGQNGKRKLIQYLKSDFEGKPYEFHDFMEKGFIWDKTKKGWHYWSGVQVNEKYANASPLSKPQPTTKQ